MNTGSTPRPAPRIDLHKLDIKPLDPALDRTAFSCGIDLLDRFFRDHAARFHVAYKTRVRIALYEGRIVGFYWLAVQSPAFHEFSANETLTVEFANTDLDKMPCVYLGMIATSKDLQGAGIGRTMMVHAMRQTLQIAELVGVYALTLEAIDAATAVKYKKWGFKYYVPEKLWMYIPVATIREAYSRQG